MAVAGLAAGLAVLAGGAHLLVAPSPDAMAWVSLRFPRDLDEESVLGFLRTLAGDRRKHLVVFEVAAEKGRIRFRLGAAGIVLDSMVERLHSFAPGVVATPTTRQVSGFAESWRLGFSTRNRPIRVGDGAIMSRSLLTVLDGAYRTDRVVMQWVLGPRLQPAAVSNSMQTLPTESLLHEPVSYTHLTLPTN